MLRRRLAYILVLLCALLFQIFFTAYLASFLLVLCLLFPLFSLLLSLPAMTRCSITLSPSLPEVERGSPCRWVVTVRGGHHLPLARMTYRLKEDNLLTGHHARLRRALSGASEGVRLSEPAYTSHCGMVTCTLSHPRICDLLGLFSVHPKAPPTAQLLVLPRPVEPEELPQLPQGGRESAGLRPRPGGGPGEDYDLRGYRPGDPMRTVHWKLSSKWDELVVRETLEDQQVALVLTFDLFGAPETLDALFDRLYALSRLLIGRGQPHYIQWAHPESGQPQSHLIDGQRAFLACLVHIFSTPAPAQGKSILDHPPRVEGVEGPVRRFHLSAPPQVGGDMP